MNKLPPLIELRAFEAAARHLSFKKAAAELGVTPTAISHQVRLLEQYCGKALFRRKPRPLSLTDAGAKLSPVVRNGLEAFATGSSAPSGAKTVDRPLSITTTNAFAARWLVPRLPHWRKQRPEMHRLMASARTVFWTYLPETRMWRSAMPPPAKHSGRALPKSS